MDDDLFLSEQHAHSQRWAIVEDDGCSAWLYLTAPESTKPVASCWLYNRTPAPPERNFARGESSVVPLTHTGSSAPLLPPPAQSVSFRWSASGEAVAVLFGGGLIGFIAGASGYSKYLKTAGPYGSPLDPGLYISEFGEA